MIFYQLNERRGSCLIYLFDKALRDQTEQTPTHFITGIKCKNIS